MPSDSSLHTPSQAYKQEVHARQHGLNFICSSSTHAWQLLVAELRMQRQLLGLNARGLLAQGMQMVEDLLSLPAAQRQHQDVKNQACTQAQFAEKRIW
jgi:hypothetical protein